MGALVGGEVRWCLLGRGGLGGLGGGATALGTRSAVAELVGSPGRLGQEDWLLLLRGEEVVFAGRAEVHSFV